MTQALIDYDVRLDDVLIMCDDKDAIDPSKNLTRSDHGKKRPSESNASSSSSTTLNHPSSSHPLDDTLDENNNESFHSNSSSLSQNISSSSNVVSRVRQNPPRESHNLNTYLSETINLQTQQGDAHREGLRSIGQALKNMIGSLSSSSSDSELHVGAYKVGLESIEARLDVYKKNEAVFEKDIKILKLDIMFRDNALTEHRKKFEKGEKERDDLKLTLEKFENSSKNLSKLLDSQIYDKFKTGEGFNSQVFDNQVNDKYKIGKGYHAVPPPYTGNFMEPKLDLIIADVDEYVLSESVTSVPAVATSKAIELVSDDKLEKKTIFLTVTMMEFVRSKQQEKPVRKPVMYAEMYRERVVYGNIYTRVNYNYSTKKAHPSAHRNMAQRAVLMKTGLRPLNTARPVNTVHPKTTVYSARPMSRFSKSSQITVKRPYQIRTALTNKNFSQKVNTAKGKFYTARPKAVNTARPVNTAHPKTIVYSARPMSRFSKSSQITVKRPYQIRTALTNKNFSQKVNTAKGKFYTARPKAVNTARLNSAVVNVVRENQGHPQKEDQGYVVSGCSRHMTWNMSYLSDLRNLMEDMLPLGEEPKEEKLLNASNDEPEPYSDAGKKHDECFWQTVTARTLDNGEIELTATIDGKVKIVTEAYVRRHLQLADSDGISSLLTTEIFEQLSLIGVSLIVGLDLSMLAIILNRLRKIYSKTPHPKKGEYDIWAMKMEHYLSHTDYPIWQVIQNGNGPVSITTDTNKIIKVLPPKTAEEVMARERNRKARTTLLMALTEDHLAKFHKMADAKEMSLPSSWSQVALIMRAKPGLDTLSFDDLYNNLRVFKRDVKGTTASTSNTHNVAFVSAENTSSTNDVSNAYSVSSPSVSKSQKEGSSSYTDEVIHSFFANQSSTPQLDYDDLEQINDDDMEKMDLKWQVAMISMRIKKFHKRTGRKLEFDTKDPIGFDKTKVECFNCYKLGHFPRDCRAKGNQDSRRRDVGYNGNKTRDNGRRPAYQDHSKALEDAPNYAMMAYSSSNSGSDNEVTSCSKACEESYARLKKLFMKIDLDDKTDVLADHKKLLAEVLKEKEDLKTKFENWQNSSKNLSKLLNKQMSVNDKFGLRYGDYRYSSILSYENEVLQSVFMNKASDLEDTPVNDRFANGMHVVPPLMTRNYMPFGPDVENRLL
nr:hypothetical protein [Tanacetum cinerariifolium]